LPKARVYRDRYDAVFPHTHERAVVVDLAMPKQSCEQSERVVSQHLIDEWFLDRLQRTATGCSVPVQRRLDDLREELSGGAKPFGRSAIPAV
jgi:hypothetical protein